MRTGQEPVGMGECTRSWVSVQRVCIEHGSVCDLGWTYAECGVSVHSVSVHKVQVSARGVDGCAWGTGSEFVSTEECL